MLPVRNYPNTFFSPTYPLGSKSTKGSDVAFAGLPRFSGLPKYQPDVFEANLKETSLKCAESETPKTGQRLNIKA
jgi:hypothetical protein